MKKVLTFIFSLIIGTLLVFTKKQSESTVTSYSIILLIVLLVTSIPIIKYIFPKLKELGIGTIDFYPNLLKKLFKNR